MPLNLTVTLNAETDTIPVNQAEYDGPYFAEYKDKFIRVASERPQPGGNYEIVLEMPLPAGSTVRLYKIVPSMYNMITSDYNFEQAVEEVQNHLKFIELTKNLEGYPLTYFSSLNKVINRITKENPIQIYPLSGPTVYNNKTLGKKLIEFLAGAEPSDRSSGTGLVVVPSSIYNISVKNRFGFNTLIDYNIFKVFYVDAQSEFKISDIKAVSYDDRGASQTLSIKDYYIKVDGGEPEFISRPLGKEIIKLSKDETSPTVIEIYLKEYIDLSLVPSPLVGYAMDRSFGREQIEINFKGLPYVNHKFTQRMFPTNDDFIFGQYNWTLLN